MDQKDYYAILDVPPGAELSIIEVSYWRLARRYNAALAADPKASRLLRDLNEAYEVLTAPQLRGEHDKLPARVAVGTEAACRPQRRLWGWWRRHAQDGKERVAPEKPVQVQPVTPIATVAAVESKDPKAPKADSLVGSGVQLETAAREGAAEEPQEASAPKVMADGPSLVRWEMPALQAFVASTGIAVLGALALAAGADPGLTLILGGVAMFFCLVPWRFGRLPHAHLPPLHDPRLPDKAQRAAALRESTAAMVARWRQSAGLLDGPGGPTAAGKPAQPSNSQPPPHP
jgi:hypothetical protein